MSDDDRDERLLRWLAEDRGRRGAPPADATLTVFTDDVAQMRRLRHATGAEHYRVVAPKSLLPADQMPAGVDPVSCVCVRCKAPCWRDATQPHVSWEKFLCLPCNAVTVAVGVDPEG